MARIRVLAENPPPPRGYVEDQLRELRDYITRMKDELEFLLAHLGEDNLDSVLTGYVGQIRTQTGEIEDINTALAGKQDTLTFDDSPTSGSNNPVKSGGVYTALGGKQDTLTFDNSPTSGSSNPVKSGGVYTALASKPTIYRDFVLPAGKSLEITTTNRYGNYALLVCLQGARSTTNGVYYVAGYSMNTTYHVVKTLADASDIAVVNVAGGKITITNNHASESVLAVILELIVNPASMLTYEVTT